MSSDTNIIQPRKGDQSNRDVVINLVAGVESIHHVQGNSTYFYDALAPFKISYDSGAFVTREKSTGDNFFYNTLRFLSAVDQRIIVNLGFGDATTDNRVSLSTGNLSLTVGVASSFAERNIVILPNTLTQLIPSNPNRAEIMLGLAPGESGTLWLGPVGNVIGKGIFVLPGQQHVLSNTAAVYGINSQGCTINMLESIT